MTTYQPPTFAAPTPGGYSQNYTYIPTHDELGEPTINMSVLNEHEDHDADEDDAATLRVHVAGREASESRAALIRTPSPTVSEYNALHNIKKQRTTKENIIYYSVIAVAITFSVVISVEHDKIINALKPETNWMASHPAGFLIPIAIFIVLSYVLAS